MLHPVNDERNMLNATWSVGRYFGQPTINRHDTPIGSSAMCKIQLLLLHYYFIVIVSVAAHFMRFIARTFGRYLTLNEKEKPKFIHIAISILSFKLNTFH